MTKYNYIVLQLAVRIANKVGNIIINPPITDRYLHLKIEIICCLSLVEEQRVRQLFPVEEFGDRKLS